MYKCKNLDCNLIIEDDKVSNNPSPKILYMVKNKLCSKCGSELEYINELKIISDKYKKSMNIFYDTKK